MANNLVSESHEKKLKYISKSCTDHEIQTKYACNSCAIHNQRNWRQKTWTANQTIL